MQLITDDVAIFAFLEKTGQASFDPLKPVALEFRTEQQQVLLIFNPREELKGCRLYLLDLHSADTEIESELLPALLALPEEPEYATLKNDALSLVEMLINRRNSGRLFYDAH